jgi:dipeptidyl aminopeptidase/acylaminoacyl peptidase
MRKQLSPARIGLPLAGALLLALGACQDVPTEPAASGEVYMSVEAASTGYVTCGQEIPVTATVTDARGKLVTGFLVNFNVLAGGGRMFGGAALSNHKGIAQDIWTIGSGANLLNTMAVRAVDATTGVGTTYFTQTVTTLSKIAFVSNRDANNEIYVMNADGLSVTNLTNTNLMVHDRSPSWSPDGSKIAFSSNRYDRNIYVMNADGSNPTRLTDHAAWDEAPAWSPDGRKIAFMSRRDGNHEIYVMNADGSNPANLTRHAASDRTPAWSPDGSKIAFVSSRDGSWDIYVMNADGSNPTRLTHKLNVMPDENLAWSGCTAP